MRKKKIVGIVFGISVGIIVISVLATIPTVPMINEKMGNDEYLQNCADLFDDYYLEIDSEIAYDTLIENKCWTNSDSWENKSEYYVTLAGEYPDFRKDVITMRETEKER